MEIYRNKISELRNHLTSKEITLITGPRQVGKTTLMLQLKRELEEKKEKTLFFNLDYQPDKEFLSAQEKLVNKIKLEYPEGKVFIFIDEIQRIENAGLFLKGIYDKNLPWKFIVSGSGSLELKEKIHESLAGRKRIFEILPVSFIEFVNFKTDYNYKDKLTTYFDVENREVKLLLDEYLDFGGYPRIITEKNIENKSYLMNDIYSSYIGKDITGLLNLQNPDAFNRMIRLLAANVGYPINYSRLSKDTGLSISTLKKYLWYTEKTFIIKSVTPFHSNIRKEITKSPVLYFNDIGMRNFSAGTFGIVTKTEIAGAVFQNFIAMQLYNLINEKNWEIHFWRTTDKAEVDIVIDKKTDVIPVEIKYSNFNKPTVPRSLRSFIEKYNPRKAYLINLNFEDKIKINNCTVVFVPYYKIFFEDI